MKALLNKMGYEVYKKDIPENYVLNNNEIEKINKLTLTIDKVQYGSGLRLIENWLNVDLNNQNNFIQDPYTLGYNLTKPHPFKDETFIFGFSEDFIEHLYQPDQLLFLTEAFRTFKKGGILRLSFPGLEGVLNRHYINNDINTALLAKADAYTNWGHLHFFSFEELSLVCKHIGFSKIEKVQFGQSKYPELNNRETRIEQAELNTIVEITK